MSLPPTSPSRPSTATTRTLGDFAGQALLIVNVASQCGFTPQYAGLEALHRRFRERGFAVLGFPCDQFGHQEPGDEAEIKQFCTDTVRCDVPDVRQDRGQRRRTPTRCSRRSSRKRPASSARRRSSGTSPSSWSTATAASCAAMRRPTSPRRSRRTSRRCSAEALGPSILPLPEPRHVRQSSPCHRRFARHRPRLRVARRQERLVGRRQLSRRREGGRRGRRDDRQRRRPRRRAQGRRVGRSRCDRHVRRRGEGARAA